MADTRWWRPATRSEWAEYVVIVLAVLVALAMWLLPIGPPPLLLVPWLVVALLVARVVADRAGRAG